MNSKWICPRCGVSSTTKQNLKNHLRKKKICKPIVADIDREIYISEELYGCKKEINKEVSSFCHHFDKPKRHHLSSSVINPSSINKKFINLSSFIKNEDDSKSNPDFECIFCKKPLSSRQSKWRHEQICTSNTEKLGQNDVVTELRIKLEAKDTIIDELKNQIEVLLKNQGNNNIHNTTQYNIDVKINSFGQENISYITKEYINNLIKNGPVNTIPKLLEHIHFNPNHTENHNIKIPNKKQNYAQVFNGDTWVYKDKNETITNMSDRAYGILNEHYHNGTNTYMDKFKSLYDSDDKKVLKRISKDTELMIINNQTA